MERENLNPLFEPYAVRTVELANRIVVAPMSQYRAVEGIANDWHLVNAGRFALGGVGAFIIEATSVTRDGRGTLGDLGLWTDEQIKPLARVADFLRANGTVPGIQLNHAGRKSGRQRPWGGNQSLPEAFERDNPDAWPIHGATSAPWADGGAGCIPLGEAELYELADRWGDAAARAAKAGYQILEIHAAHGYLLHQFLSPLSNDREDAFGGNLAGRMRFPLLVAQKVRKSWPADLPLFVRISATDWIDGGWSVEDSIIFSRKLHRIGVDLIDVSSGGLVVAKTDLGPGYQVAMAARIREEASVPTMAVGHIFEEGQAARVPKCGAADLVAIGRQALISPNWALNAMSRARRDDPFGGWPHEAGWWLARRMIDYPDDSIPNSPALAI